MTETDDPRQRPQKSFAVNPLDAAIATLRGLVCVLVGRVDSSRAPTRLTLSSLDCAVQMCYRFLLLLRDFGILHLPGLTIDRTVSHWREKMMEANLEDDKVDIFRV